MYVYQDITEVPVGPVDGTNTSFQTTQQFFLKSLVVWRSDSVQSFTYQNGLLDFDLNTHTFNMATPPPAGVQLTCTYKTAVPEPGVSEVTPINISDVAPPMVLRIQLANGYVFMPVDHSTSEVQFNVRARPYRTAMVVGRVVSNNFENRVLVFQYQDLTLPNNYLTAVVPYGRVKVAERQIPGTYVSDNVNRLRIPAYAPVRGIP